MQYRFTRASQPSHRTSVDLHHTVIRNAQVKLARPYRSSNSVIFWSHFGSLSCVVCCLLILGSVATARAQTSARVESDDALQKRAVASMRRGEFADAQDIYRQLTLRDENNVRARLGLSYALLKLRDTVAAFHEADRAVGLARDAESGARACALRGTTLLMLGDFKRATEQFQLAYSLNQEEPLAVAGTALINMYESRVDQSVTGLRYAVRLEPREPDFWFNLAHAAARSERYGEAADAYREFLRIAPFTDRDRRERIQGMIAFLQFLTTREKVYRISGATETTVAFELRNNRPIVTVLLENSREPLRFVIDTGSGMCVVAQQTADRLGIREVARGGVARGIGGEGKFPIVYGFLPVIKIGDARVENVPVYIRPLQSKQEQIDGYIGLSLLTKYLTSLDYGTKQLTLLRGKERKRAALELRATQEQRMEIPIRVAPSGFWSGEVDIEGADGTHNFIVDTGASVSVVAKSLADREGMKGFAQNRSVSVFGAAGTSLDVPVMMLPQIAFGYTRRNVTAVVLDLTTVNETAGFEQLGIIGGNILRHYRVTFDSERASVTLEPTS